MSKWIMPVIVAGLWVVVGFVVLRKIAVAAMNLLMEIGSWFKK